MTHRHFLISLLYTSLLLSPWLAASAQRIVAEKTTIDCGRTGFQQPVKATFHLRNKGLLPLEIKRVLPDCGCTTVEAPKRAGIGERFTISVTYDARMLGHYQKQVAVYSNGSKKPLYLTMKGQIMADLHDYTGTYPIDMQGLRVDQGELTFDDVRRGETPSIELHVVNDGSQPMVPNLLHLPPYLTATCVPQRIRPNEVATITVTLHSDRLHDYGLTQTSIHLAQQLGEKVSPDNELTVSAVLLPTLSEQTNASGPHPQIQLSAEELQMGPFGKKKKLSGEILISNTGQATLDISSLQMFNRGLRVTLPKQSLAPGEKTKLKITAIADDLKKERTAARILMITNDPNRSKIIIKVVTGL